MRFSFHTDALLDLQSIVEFHTRNSSPDYARRVVAAVYAALELRSDNELPMLARYNPTDKNYEIVLPEYGLIVAYQFVHGTLVVLSVMSDRQRR